MDENLADNVEDVDHGNERDQIVEACLSNPLIVRKILEHISSKQLLQISLVNKLWRSEAGSVIRKRGNLIANLRSKPCSGGRCRCATILAFLSDLPELGAAPFSGIQFDNYHEHRLQPMSPGNQAWIENLYLDHLSLRSVSVEMFGPWLKFINYPTILLAKTVLEEFCGDLEELSIAITHDHGDFVEKVIGDCNFPRLKILKVCAWTLQEDGETYMKVLLSRAPNLKMLHTNWNINLALELLQGTSVGFVYTTTVCAPFDKISENVINAIRLENMELKYTGRGFNFERFNRIAPMLLQASCSTTLRRIAVDAVLAVSLMCFGVRLENVKNFRIDVDFLQLERHEPNILRIVKNLDFTRIFPNLKKVYIANNERTVVPQLLPDHMNALMEQATAVLREPMLDRAARVKELGFRWNRVTAAAEFFVEMFPNIEKLDIATCGGGQSPFRSIWNWLDLKELAVHGNLLPETGNLDSVFCGIFPEEVVELRLKGEEYLKNVNIVPVMPAITCMKNLRIISLRHHVDLPIHDEATFLFSKVTVLLAFARRPTLAASLTVSAYDDPPAMTHLKPYVSVASVIKEYEERDD